MKDCSKFLNMIVDDFIEDFIRGYGLADGFRLIAIFGIIRYCYIVEIISRIERDDLLKRLSDTVGSFFGNNICNPFDFSL